jgi:4a-hydroxytetrahydrobiopterin dehydratase
MATLSDQEIATALESLPGWERAGDAIAKQYRFDRFPDAVAFVVRLSYAAEAADHHPDLDIRYNKVAVALSTHSEGGITDKDVALARTIEGLAPAAG